MLNGSRYSLNNFHHGTATPLVEVTQCGNTAHLSVGYIALDLSHPWEVERDPEVLPPSPVDSNS